jgi:Sulfotransferase family
MARRASLRELHPPRASRSGPVRPTFLVIGAMKAGTDSLWHYLRSHPRVFLSQPKELDFFAEEGSWGRGLDWYLGHFRDAADATAVGEASTSYSKYPHHAGVPGRIAQLLPEVRLVYLVRHPLDRIRSHYLHEVLLGRERRPLERAVALDPAYLDVSRYAMQIDRYLEFFPSDRLLVVTSEGLRSDRMATVERILGFLGVDPEVAQEALAAELHRTAETRLPRGPARALGGRPAVARVRAALPPFARRVAMRLLTRGVDPARATVSDQLRARLESALRQDVARLRRHLEPDFDGWGIG